MTLTLLERLVREVAGMPDFFKRIIALNIGCTVAELESLGDALAGLKQSGVSIGSDEGFDAVTEALGSLWSLSVDHQMRAIETVLQNADCFDGDIKAFNAMLLRINKPWAVVDRELVTLMLQDINVD